MVLTDPGHYELANGKKCSFVVLQKDCLNDAGAMNNDGSVGNSGGWNACPRRTWCNDVYRNAIPATLRPIFKQFITYAANGSGSISVASTDYFSLFSEKEVFGSSSYANAAAEANNSQLNYYKPSTSRIKYANSRSSVWWERSTLSNNAYCFCAVYSNGKSGSNNYYVMSGLAPFGCI